MPDKIKSVSAVLPPPPPHMVGDAFRVHNFFPMGHRLGRDRMSPFFLLDYGARRELEPTAKPRGVGAHPHRGFETVTIGYHGRVAHHDSAGNSGVIGEGDVQWMTAGSGVLHKEYQDEEFARSGGPMQMVQLWVNLPARFKMTAPKYQALTHAMMGRHELPSGAVGAAGVAGAAGAGTVEVIAGEFQGTKGPGSSFTPVSLFNVRLEKGASLDFDLPSHYNTGILIIEGALLANGSAAPVDHFVLFENDGERISLRATEAATALVLSGEPIDEPIAAYGPFVMNTQEEIVQAIDDFNAGKFGRLD